MAGLADMLTPKQPLNPFMQLLASAESPRERAWLEQLLLNPDDAAQDPAAHDFGARGPTPRNMAESLVTMPMRAMEAANSTVGPSGGYVRSPGAMDFATETALGLVGTGAAGQFAKGRPPEGVLGIVPVPDAKALRGIENALPATDDFIKAVKGTPSARITDNGLEITVQRNQRPEQSGADSVRGGVFYLPAGSKDAKHYSGTGHNFAYGGTDKIKGDTLFRNPLFVKGATGGKAPQAAFDQLKGKGAYEAMRKEALESMPPYSLKDQGLREELVSRFLEKYAPEMVDLAPTILMNSTKGNQLAYALQEAAVASAARKAGHDGVVGYSVKRTTKEPFISEVFDVRENTYPTPDGGFSVWEQYEP
jgi:hypothetical protein